MRKFEKIVLYFLLAILTGCDPVHSLRLENQTNRNIEVIYLPSLNTTLEKSLNVEIVENNGLKMNRIFLDSAHFLILGTVVARYEPKANDIELDYLEIRYGMDTIQLKGKNAIFSTIHKINKLDWRFVVK